MALYFIDRLPPNPDLPVQQTLALTAEERTRSRFYFPTESGQGVYLRLPRGTVLRQGDLLRSAEDIYLRVIAKPEPVMVVTASTPLLLLRAAYHLGNRHVPLQVTTDYLRFSPDSVLRDMLEQLGLQVAEAVLPFEPETGAYGSSSHSHHHDHNHSHAADNEFAQEYLNQSEKRHPEYPGSHQHDHSHQI